MKLQEIRKQKGLSQSQLAEKSNVSVRMIQYYEQGRNDLKQANAITVYYLAKALDVSMETLLDI